MKADLRSDIYLRNFIEGEICNEPRLAASGSFYLTQICGDGGMWKRADLGKEGDLGGRVPSGREFVLDGGSRRYCTTEPEKVFACGYKKFLPALA